MIKSKTLISKQAKRKTNSELIEIILTAKKNEAWLELAGILSGPRRKMSNLNLDQINKEVKEGERVLVPGKILSQGEIDKKIKISALNFSEKAREKLLNAKCEVLSILDEIKSNPSAKGIRILR